MKRSRLNHGKPLAHVGDRKKAEIAKTKGKRLAYLLAHPICEIGYVLWVNQTFGWDGCTTGSTCVHERQKRSALGSLTDESNIMASCWYCNVWVEDNPALAEELGLVVKSYQDPEDVDVLRIELDDDE